MKFRVTYKNSWNELKTIVFEEDNYFDAIRNANSMFGSDKIISIEELDKPNTADYSVNIHEDDTWDWLNDN